ncbi:MAG: MATE family efflux transporter [Clostridiales bacterium]|jgi:putative MATE family efflux protein|nr:MATE family efflux transporter [Clostridiales bacterium]
MTQGKTWKILLKFAVPMALSSAFQLLYTVADSAVVGRLIGVSAFAATGAAWACFMLALTLTLGLTQGFGLIFSQRHGASDKAGLWSAWKSALLLCVVLGVPFSVVGGLAAKPLLALMSTPADIIDGSALYLRILFGGLIIPIVCNTAYAMLRGLGDSKTPMASVMLSSLVNVALDILLVQAFSMGIAGVAIATLVSQALAAAWCYYRISKRFSKEDRANKIVKGDASLLLKYGTPLAARNIIISLGGLAMQSSVNVFGTVFIAGIAAPWKLYGLLEIIGGACTGASATFIAQNFGAKKMDRVREAIKVAGIAMLAASLGIAAISIIWGRPMLSVLVSGEQAQAVLDIGKVQLNFMAGTLPFLYLLFLLRAALEGTGRVTASFISGVAEMAARVACSFALPPFLGEWGVYIAQVVGWPVSALVLAVMFAISWRKGDFKGAENKA